MSDSNSGWVQQSVDAVLVVEDDQDPEEYSASVIVSDELNSTDIPSGNILVESSVEELSDYDNSDVEHDDGELISESDVLDGNILVESSMEELTDHDDSDLEHDDRYFSSESDVADSKAGDVEEFEEIETEDESEEWLTISASESSTTELYEGSPISTKASLALLTELAQRHGFSKNALSDVLKVVSAHLPQQPDVLKSRFLFDNAVSKLTAQSAKPIVHFLCPCCKCLMKDQTNCLTAGCPYNGVENPLFF